MTVLENPSQIVRGVKPLKQKPKYGDKAFTFDKEFQVNPYNFPLTKYTTYKIYGYTKDPYTGMKRPHWLTKQFPTGSEVTPRKCGLDGFFDIKPINQII